MKIKSTERRIFEIISVISGLVLALLLIINITKLFLSVRLPYNFVFFINFLCGIFVLIVVGAIFQEDSRIGGLLLASISIPLLWYFASVERIIVDALIIGIVAGALIVLYVLRSGRFDMLAGFSKIFLNTFFIIILAYLSLPLFLSPIVVFERGYEYAMGFALLVSVFIISKRNIRGIKADVFFFGLSRSGKTYLLLSLDHYMIKRGIGYPVGEGVIISENPDELKINRMKAEVEEGKLIRSTRANEVAEYLFKGEKWGIIKVKLTFVDYGGEIIPKIIPKLNEDEYKKTIDKLSEKLELKKSHINRSIGSIKFLKEQIEREHKKVFEDDPDMMSDMILAYLYKKFENAGKVIVLIDGKQVGEFIKNEKAGELIKSFSILNEILQIFNDKKFALLVTKADEFDDFIERMVGKRLVDIVEKKDAIKLEEKIYEKLTEISALKGIIARMNRIAVPVHFFLNSVDVRRTTSAKIVDPTNIWRLGHERLERFIFF